MRNITFFRKQTGFWYSEHWIKLFISDSFPFHIVVNNTLFFSCDVPFKKCAGYAFQHRTSYRFTYQCFLKCLIMLMWAIGRISAIACVIWSWLFLIGVSKWPSTTATGGLEIFTLFKFSTFEPSWVLTNSNFSYSTILTNGTYLCFFFCQNKSLLNIVDICGCWRKINLLEQMSATETRYQL